MKTRLIEVIKPLIEHRTTKQINLVELEKKGSPESTETDLESDAKNSLSSANVP